MTFLSNYDRVRRCIAGEPVEQIPYMLYINFPFIKSVTGITSQSYFSDPQMQLEAQVETFRRIGVGGGLVSPDFGTVTEASAFGGKIVYDNTGIPSLKPDPEVTIETLAQLPATDPADGQMMARYLSFLEYFVSHMPEGFRCTSSNTMAPFTAAAEVRGISDLCMDIIEEPELSIDFLNTVTQTEIAFFREQEKILGDSFDRIFLSDDISSFLSANQYRQFVMPTYRQIFQAFPHVQHWLHNDGNATHLAPLIAQTGVHAWHIGKTMDMGELLRLTEEKVVLFGNLDPVSVLLQGSEMTVRTQVEKEIREYGNTGKYICSSGGFINYGTPIGNIQAMVDALH